MPVDEQTHRHLGGSGGIGRDFSVKSLRRRDAVAPQTRVHMTCGRAASGREAVLPEPLNEPVVIWGQARAECLARRR